MIYKLHQLRILVIVHGSKSHLNAIAGPCRALCISGHKLLVCSNHLVSDSACNYGLEMVELNCMPFASDFEKYIVQQKDGNCFSKYFLELYMRMSRQLYSQRKDQLQHIVEEFSPDLILLDILYSSDYLLLKPLMLHHKFQIMYLTTKVSLVRTKTTPPQSTAMVPSSEGNVADAWFWYNLRKRLRYSYQYIKYLGHDRLSELKWAAKRVSEEEYYSIMQQDVVGEKFSHLPEISLIPEEFEFQPFRPSPLQNYVGFQLFDRSTIEPELPSRLLKLINIRKEEQGKIIYCSFGTLYGQYQNIIIRFLRILHKISTDSGNILLIVAINRSLARHLPFHNSTFAYCDDYFPQYNLLKHVDLFITHGGLNSIKEAIHFEVPMLVFPFAKHWDPLGNASRVLYHKFGNMGRLRSVSAHELKIKIDSVLKATDEIKNHMRNFNNRTEKYTDKYFIKTLYSLMESGGGSESCC